MDISFVVENEKFNYRVCAMIISNGEIFAPVSVFSDLFERSVISKGNGTYIIGDMEEALYSKLLSYIN